ncbi:9518_t:CDS:2, partial [Ambispora leptoticha]
MEKPGTSEYKALQALKRAGISLDKLLERVEKGRQAKAEGQTKKRQVNKNGISIELRGKSIVRAQWGDKLVDTETLPTLEIYQE